MLTTALSKLVRKIASIGEELVFVLALAAKLVYDQHVDGHETTRHVEVVRVTASASETRERSARVVAVVPEGLEMRAAAEVVRRAEVARAVAEAQRVQIAAHHARVAEQRAQERVRQDTQRRAREDAQRAADETRKLRDLERLARQQALHAERLAELRSHITGQVEQGAPARVRVDVHNVKHVPITGVTVVRGS
jgi:hypothetical protein